MLVYQKTMFDCYYCIRSFWQLETLEKKASKIYFLYYYNDMQKCEAFIAFENTCSTAMTYGILASLDYVNFNAHYC